MKKITTFRFTKILLSALAALFAFTLVLQSCGLYSFTGAKIAPDVKTISIKYFPNNAVMVQPTLSRKLTEAMRDKFVSQSSLSLVNNNGDMNLEGEITDYSSDPVAIASDQKAALQRLKITISVRFTNKKDDKMNFETSFSRYADFDSKQRLSDVEVGLIDQITEELAQDVFNKAIINW